jgi:hypothetical protein
MDGEAERDSATNARPQTVSAETVQLKLGNVSVVVDHDWQAITPARKAQIKVLSNLLDGRLRAESRTFDERRTRGVAGGEEIGPEPECSARIGSDVRLRVSRHHDFHSQHRVSRIPWWRAERRVREEQRAAMPLSG